MQIKQFGHLAFHCKDLDKMMDFYGNIIGCKEKFRLSYGGLYEKLKAVSEAGGKVPRLLYRHAYKKRNDIWMVYMEFAEGVFIELFDQAFTFMPHKAKHYHYNYQHFGLVVDDIHACRKELEARGLQFDTEIEMGDEHTYQMWAHDPEGNKLEIMQYTEKSYQVVGGRNDA